MNASNSQPSESVALAASAEKGMAVHTAVDELWHGVVAHRALITTSLTNESSVLAIVATSNIFCDSENCIQSRGAIDLISSVSYFDDLLSTLHQSILIPLWTFAGLPWEGCAEVAELGFARTP